MSHKGRRNTAKTNILHCMVKPRMLRDDGDRCTKGKLQSFSILETHLRRGDYLRLRLNPRLRDRIVSPVSATQSYLLQFTVNVSLIQINEMDFHTFGVILADIYIFYLWQIFLHKADRRKRLQWSNMRHARNIDVKVCCSRGILKMSGRERKVFL